MASTYLDSASSAPLHPVARQALLAALDEGWADPARLYGAGRRARMLLDGAREAVAGCLGARPDEVSFAESGTRAAHLAVLGGLAGRRRAGPRLVHSAIEHSAVLAAARWHAGQGGVASSVPVDRLGRVDTEAYAAALRGGDVALAALIGASHEVGTVQPVAEVAGLCAGAGVPLYVDAAQCAGRLPVPEGWSLLTASAHKWGGPAGVGVLAVRKGVRWRAPGPDDDRGRVPGFPNVPAVLAAAAALQAATGEAEREDARLRPLVDLIRTRVPELVPDVEVVGDPVDRLPHLVTFSCLYVDGEALVHELDRRGFAVSSGSSCTSAVQSPSHVLEAMGVLSHGNVRLSLHRDTTPGDVDRFLVAFPDVVAGLRRTAGVQGL